MKQKKSISIIVISLIPICLAINVVGGNLASALKIPLYVDSIGTILIGMLVIIFFLLKKPAAKP